MQKTITIDDKEVKFKSNAVMPIIFKNQFGYDILQVILPLISEMLKGIESFDDVAANPQTISSMLENVYSLEIVHILNLVWAMAKAANANIDDPEKWFAQFEDFPIYDIGKELSEILIPSLITKKKSIPKVTKKPKQ